MKWLAGVTLALPIAAMCIAQPSGGGRSDKPDFSKVTSKPLADALVAQGKLSPILYFPAELGGEDVPENKGYVTPEAAASREKIVEELAGALRQKLINKMTVTPDYRGYSIVPIRITFDAVGGRKKVRIIRTLEVW